MFQWRVWATGERWSMGQVIVLTSNPCFRSVQVVRGGSDQVRADSARYKHLCPAHGDHGHSSHVATSATTESLRPSEGINLPVHVVNWMDRAAACST